MSGAEARDRVAIAGHAAGIEALAHGIAAGGNPAAWAGVGDALAQSLTVGQIMGLASAAFRALSARRPHDAVMLAAAIADDLAEQHETAPPPTWGPEHLDWEAQAWAAGLTQRARGVFLVAIWRRMSDDERRGFLAAAMDGMRAR